MRANERVFESGRIAIVLFALTLVPQIGFADLNDLGEDISIRPDGGIDYRVDFRGRADARINFDLDRGLDSRGLPLYPTPLAESGETTTSQTLTVADVRLRTDLAAYAPFGDVAAKLRVDWFDLAAGSTADGPSQAVVSQAPSRTISVRRAYFETLTPFGLLTVGRTGAHWGTGMLANGGDCMDCETGYAADRVAFTTPLAGHIWAVAYDIGFVGTTSNADHVIDLAPNDDVRSLTFATLRYRTPRAIQRRLNADVSTLDYGLSYSHRWQKFDSPGAYLEGFPDDVVVPRRLHANLVSAYIDFRFPLATIRSEGAILNGSIDEPSLLPGVSFDRPLNFTQWGAVLETTFGRPGGPLNVGLNAGLASGDGAPGFGARPGVLETPPEAGAFDGPQANPPFDNAINNFSFHPDYHVDRILFRRVLGTVTDAVYVRPHATWRAIKSNRSNLTLDVATTVSFAMNASSTPNNEAFLGVEIDPTLSYENGPFRVDLQYALFLPGDAFDGPIGSKPAQLLKTILVARF